MEPMPKPCRNQKPGSRRRDCGRPYRIQQRCWAMLWCTRPWLAVEVQGLGFRGTGLGFRVLGIRLKASVLV